MPIEIFQNSSASTLNGAINNSVTSLVVTDASKFPATGNFRIIIDSEILLVTAVSGTTFTIVRGIEGTTAAAHSNGAAITHVLTAGSFQQWLTDRGIIINTNPGDRKPVTAGTYDEEFEGTIDTLPSGWSWVSAPSGGDTWTLNSDYPSILCLTSAGGGSNYILKKTISPATNFGFWLKIAFATTVNNESSNVRLYLYNSTEAEGRCAEFHPSGPGGINVRGLVTSGSSEGVWAGPYLIGQIVNTLYIGVVKDSSNNWEAYCSNNGIGWSRFAGPTSHSFTVDHISIKMNTPSSKTGKTGLDWLRYKPDLTFPG
jgi:hypothetical protein